jgi:hypothetical protein
MLKKGTKVFELQVHSSQSKQDSEFRYLFFQLRRGNPFMSITVEGRGGGRGGRGRGWVV